MSPRLFLARALVVACSVLAPVLFARILTCPRCSYEHEAGAPVCTNCQFTLPATGPVPPADSTVAPAATAGAADESLAGAATRLLDLARVRGSNGESRVAYLLALQAEALAAAADDAELQQKAAQMGADQGRLFTTGTRLCPSCKGDGQRRIIFSTFKGEIGEQEAANLDCPFCSGRGRVSARLDLERLQSELNALRQQVQQLLRGSGYRLDAGVWWPAGTPESLPPQTLVRARRVIGRTCESCAGFGSGGCATCTGSGREVCEAKDCVMGQTPCPDCDGKRRIERAAQGRNGNISCSRCRKTGISNCEACSGRGWTACEDCEGRGQESCRTCKGKGTAEACTRCTGRGLADCSVCKGAGEVRGRTCLACEGGKQAVCTGCQGFGSRRRSL